MGIGTVKSSAAFTAYTNYAASSAKLAHSMNRLSTGQKMAMDDSAGVGISERMRAQARSTHMARQNVENAISALQTADSWMQRVSDLLGRMAELAIEAQDGTMGINDIANINAEFVALSSEITDITTKKSKFNGVQLLDSSYSTTTQVGADSGQTILIKVGSLTAMASTVAALSITNAVLANGAMTAIESAINEVSRVRAEAGGLQSRLDHTRAGLLSYEDNISAAESKIRDIDMARESSEMMKYQVLTQVGTSMMSQANQIPQQVLKLLQ